MTARLLWRYLTDRIWCVGAVYVTTGLVLALIGLLLRYQGVGLELIWSSVLYSFVLATGVLLVCGAADCTRWWPLARRLEEGGIDLAAAGNLPPGGTEEQAAFREALVALQRSAMAEVADLQAAHTRHRSFTNLWVHQMKTPVSVLSLLAQEAGDGSAPAETVAEEARKLEDGLELVLGMARLESFAADYQIRRVDLIASLREVINRRKRQFIRYAIFPSIEADDGDWAVLTDAKWTGFVLDQVISNALKYAGQGGPPGQRLSCSLCREEKRVVLTISDQGPGIPPEDLPRVFEPFFTGENGRLFGGATGIGLYLVRQVMEQLGHQVAVTSVPGHGTTVRLTYLSTS